jgi:zinc/manganese transport system substrate-binding protein
MMNRRRFLTLSLGSSLLALPIGAGLLTVSGTARADATIKAVASFSILGDMVREIGGDRVELTTLVGPNADAHTFEPRPAHSRAVGAAGIIFINGLAFEPWFKRLAASAGARGKIVIASEGVKALEFKGKEGNNRHRLDPHAWQDLSNGVLYVRNIAAALAAVDPGHASDYKSRANAYVVRLQTLHDAIKAELGAIPAGQRKVVTSHDAFGYFAAYSIEFIAPQGVSTEGEASANDVAKIIDQIRALGIRAVFLENIANSRLVEQIAKETHARIGGTLFSDALSDPDGPAPTYVKMFEHNARELVTALKPGQSDTSRNQ